MKSTLELRRAGHDDPEPELATSLASNQEFELTSLADIWEEDNDITLPRRIRCATHNFALMGVIDYIIRRQKDFWARTPHATFKSKLTFIKD